jgi:hypothetical protein
MISQNALDTFLSCISVTHSRSRTFLWRSTDQVSDLVVRPASFFDRLTEEDQVTSEEDQVTFEEDQVTLSNQRKFVSVRDLSGSVGILGESLETSERVGSVGWICLGRVDLSGF